MEMYGYYEQSISTGSEALLLEILFDYETANLLGKCIFYTRITDTFNMQIRSTC